MEWEETETIRRGSYTIVIHRPNLTKPERRKLEDQIKASLESTLRTYTRRKELENGNKHTTRIIGEK